MTMIAAVASMSALLSHHSSNPLEMVTSDPEHQYMADAIREAPSTDPLNDDSALDDQEVVHLTPRRPATMGLGKENGRGRVPTPARVSTVQIPVKTPMAGNNARFWCFSSDLEIVDDDGMATDWREHTGECASAGGVDEMSEDEDMDLEEDMEEDEEGASLDRDDSSDIFDEEEENTLRLKPVEEQDEITEEIEDLECAVPQLSENYKIVDRLGTGTFSSVYKALDLFYHTKWYNKSWHGRHPLGSSANFQSVPRPPGSKVFVAIKRIYVTSNPERIRNEISIMEECLGCRHVAQLITAFRYHDQVVAIMPYQRNEDFRDYFKDYPMIGIKAYMRCLFRALRDIHARDIVHRDVKPANFLFDARKLRGTLCDFGLAARINYNYTGHTSCLHTSPSREFPHGRIRSTSSYDVNLVKQAQKDARHKSVLPSDRVGYPEKDLRPVSKANRAGTRGFRAPEVLLKCNDQSGAIDVWSAGMIFLFFLIGKFPLFQSNDDIEALMEIASIIGRRRMEKAATLHNRTFATNVPSITQDGMTWREFVQRNNPGLFATHSPPPSATPSTSSTIDGSRTRRTTVHPSSSHSSMSIYSAEELDEALDFLEKILDPTATTRLTARDALYHPFLVEPGPGDDTYFPHPIGEGRCGRYHFRDEVTEEHCASYVGPDFDEIRKLNAGEGIAIGDDVCELHKGKPEFL